MKFGLSCFVGWFAGACHVFGLIELPIALPQVAPDSPVRAAAEAYRNGWFSRAEELAAPLAASGNADALFLMALAKEEIAAAKLSKRQAMVYFYRAAGEAGHPEGELRSWLTLIGSKVEENTDEGRSKLEQATKEGNARAMRIAGEAEARGFMRGTPDLKKAKEWWEKAAAAGDASSMLLLARLNEGVLGEMADKDLAAAKNYYRKAHEAGEKQAVLSLTRLLSASEESEARELLERAVAEGIPGAHRALCDLERKKGNDTAALEHLRQGASGGDTSCMRMLAERSMAEGEKDAGMDLLKKAAEVGDPHAAAEVGRILADKDPQSAAKYLVWAAEAEVHRAQYDLALLYLDGKLGPKDARSAVTWLTEAMKSGDAGMQYKLATLHEQGLGCPINYANAGVLYTLACNKGHSGAAGRIAFMASEGLGTRRDPASAYAYAVLAVERGDDASKPLLDKLGPLLTPTDRAEAMATLEKLRGAPGPAVGTAKEDGEGSSEK